MREQLIACHGGLEVGRLHYANDRLRFDYAETWREHRSAFPLSLSLPLAAGTHPDKLVRPLIAGLLPDNAQVLAAWGKRFHVSPRNPFRLLAHVGEECAGAVQFFTPERLEKLAPRDRRPQVKWLTKTQLIERIDALVADHSRARRIGDEGHFSLAGAQPKTGLYHDEQKDRWGIPYGHTPTTHILKPHLGEFEGYYLNEHFCLRLAARLDLPAARSELQMIGNNPVIVVTRYDRVQRNGRFQRVHQEDSCQALSCPPGNKYENEGGPTAKDLFRLIREFSHRPREDISRLLDALIFNWLIGGTDAHAKNYSFLLAGGGQVRLAPLYDLSSALPYPREIPLPKARLAMKIGGTYHLARIGGREWEKAAKIWQIPQDQLTEQRQVMIGKMKDAIKFTEREIKAELNDRPSPDRTLVTKLARALRARTKELSES